MITDKLLILALFLVTVHGTQQGKAKKLDVSADAVAAGAEVDLSGQLFSGHSAPLSEIEVVAEIVSDVPTIVWNRETLNELEPIFESEVVVQGGENKILFLKWDYQATRDLDLGFHRINLPLVYPIRYSKDWRSVLDYLQQNGVSLFGENIAVDLSSHVKSGQDGIELPLPSTLPGVGYSPYHPGNGQWFITLVRVSDIPQDIVEPAD